MKRKVLYLLFSVFLLSFSSNAQVSLIGVGATGCWENTGCDVDLVDQGGGIWTLAQYTMPGGEFKFRLNHNWDAPAGGAWGNSTFPNGTGDFTPGVGNIVAVPGTYDITFNQATGEYTFSGAPIPIVNLVGPGLAAPVNMTTADAITYTATNVSILDGGVQFEIDGDAFGATTFPEGNLGDPTVFIPVPAGTYSSITVELGEGGYVFTAAPVYPSIAIVGSGAGGWPSDPQVDANVLATTDGETYTGFVTLTAWDGVVGSGTGEIKFRSNNSWTNPPNPSWGGGSFPAGPTDAAANIVVNAAGYYGVRFTRSTGAYAFAFPTIALVGDATPTGWPTGTAGEVDPTVMTTTDGINYTLASVTLSNANLKLRQNNNWDVAWGNTTFPSGVADITPGSANIAATAGTYGVTFNRTTAQLDFGPELATKSFNASSFKAYPNPTQSEWNFTSASEKIQTIQIIDMLGKTVATVTPVSTNAKVDASALNTGMYFAKIATTNGTSTVKLVKN